MSFRGIVLRLGLHSRYASAAVMRQNIAHDAVGSALQGSEPRMIQDLDLRMDAVVLLEGKDTGNGRHRRKPLN